MRFAVGILLLLAVVLAWATVLDSRYGSEASAFAVYHAWWFLGLCGLLGGSVLASALLRFPWKKHQIGFVVTHLGILVLMAGCVLTFWRGQDGSLGLFEGASGDTAFLKTLHFEVTDGERVDEIPFRPGPFSWRNYADSSMKVEPSQRLSAFPWNGIPSDRKRPEWSVGNGVTVRVEDYVRGTVQPVSKEPTLVIWGPLEKGGKAETYALVPSRMDQRIHAPSGEAVVFWRTESAAEMAFFQNGTPDFINPTQAQLVLGLEGKIYRMPLNALPFGEAKGVEGTDWTVTLSRVEPEICMVKLTVANGKTGKNATLTLVADAPELSVQGRAENVFASLWVPTEKLEYVSPNGKPLPVEDDAERMKPMLERMHKLISGPRVEILEQGGQYATRFWKAPKLCRVFPVKVGKPFMVMPGLRMVIRSGEAEDFPGYAVVPMPISGKHHAQGGSVFVRLTATVDGVATTGWIRAADMVVGGTPEMPDDPTEVLWAQGKERTVKIMLKPDRVALGFRLRLDKFNRRLDPGTATAARYSSTVSLLDGEGNVLRENIVVNLNQPVDFQDTKTGRVWRVFQTSFRGPIPPNDPVFTQVVLPGDMREQLYVSWFTVNDAPGRGLLYFGCLLMVLGIGILYSMKAYFFK